MTTKTFAQKLAGSKLTLLAFFFMIGILNIHKPAGATSRDVVNQVQRIVRPAKIGHAGTLDPLATGVLVLCIGKATKLISHIQRMRKRYRGTFLLGQQSNTEDIEGTVQSLVGAPVPSAEEVRACLPEFLGTIQQRPPAFSALKVRGKRAYALARQGKIVELAPRPITIHELTLVEYSYPRMVVEIECGSGTYVRSLGRDIAERLGTGAVMSELVRTGVGEFRISESVSPESINESNLAGSLLPPNLAVRDLSRAQLSDMEVRRVLNGLTIENRFHLEIPPPTEIAAIDATGQLVAILVPRKGGLGPAKNFLR